jgi:hypothetical protein
VLLGVGLHALHIGLVHIGEQAKIFIKNVLRNANLALTSFEKTLWELASLVESCSKLPWNETQKGLQFGEGRDFDRCDRDENFVPPETSAHQPRSHSAPARDQSAMMNAFCDSIALGLLRSWQLCMFEDLYLNCNVYEWCEWLTTCVIEPLNNWWIKCMFRLFVNQNGQGISIGEHRRRRAPTTVSSSNRASEQQPWHTACSLHGCACKPINEGNQQLMRANLSCFEMVV